MYIHFYTLLHRDVEFMGKFNYFNYKEKRLDKFSKDEQEDLVFDLINAFSLVNNPYDSALLLQDLLTEGEVRNLAKRLRVAKLILEGKKQEEIVKELHCSFATIAKVSIWLGNAGEGFKKVIKKLPQRREVNIPKRIPGVGYGLPSILDYYISAALKKNERKRITKFIQSMKDKKVSDEDLRDEISSEFRKLKSKRR